MQPSFGLCGQVSMTTWKGRQSVFYLMMRRLLIPLPTAKTNIEARPRSKHGPHDHKPTCQSQDYGGVALHGKPNDNHNGGQGKGAALNSETIVLCMKSLAARLSHCQGPSMPILRTSEIPPLGLVNVSATDQSPVVFKLNTHNPFP